MSLHLSRLAAFSAAALISLAAAPPLRAQAAAPKPSLSPAVASLLRSSTAAYQKVRSYQHTAEFLIRTGQDRKVIAYTLALERPNRFAFRSDDAEEAAAICDGSLFINYKKTDRMYTKTKAPSDFRGINIVDDVTFQPIGTYVIALMLQGDALADHDIRDALVKATGVTTVTEDGKRYDTLIAPLTSAQVDQSGKITRPPVTLFFDAQSHLLHKAVFELDTLNGRTRVTEIIENVKIDQPVSPATFHYTPPASALWIVRGASGRGSKVTGRVWARSV